MTTSGLPGDGRAVAIVHDYFTQRGGAERVVGELVRLLPAATIHTSVFDPELLPDGVDPARVRASGLQVLRRAGLPLAPLAPVLPAAFRRIDLDGAALVVSSTSAFAHHVRAPAGVAHVAYVHTPAHFLWEPAEYFSGRGVRGRLLGPMLTALRRADRAAIARVDGLVANSRYTADRIAHVHGRTATVIQPPVDTDRFRPTAERSGRWLVVARLRRHKRLALAMAAADRRRAPLDIIGDGPDEAYLRSVAGPTIRFLGRLDDAAVADAMARCTALIVPGTEDFGLTMAETQAAGRPVVAYGRGGATEIVEDGVTGALFHDLAPDALAEAMGRIEREPMEREALVASAARFRRAVFDDAFRAHLSAVAADVARGSSR